MMPRLKARKPRPHIWVTGPDPELHKKFLVWIQQRNQAQWREEGWDFSLEDWIEMWGPWYALRGRDRGSYCMTRKDVELPWTKDNCQVITRQEHARRQGQLVAGGYRSVAQERRRTKLGLN